MRREILCVVGESGSGKSVMAKAILRLLPEPHVRVTGGQIITTARTCSRFRLKRIRAVRGGRIAMIFQEPMVALNPLMTVGRQTDEIIEVHTGLRARRAPQARRRGVRRRAPAGPRAHLSSYPHELSGGQRQRVMIAMALALEPALHHRRRADDRARRHHPGADPEAAQGAAGASTAPPSCSSRTISAWSPRSPTGWP